MPWKMADPALLISARVPPCGVWGSAPEGFISLFEGGGSPPGPASLQLELVGENAQDLVDSLPFLRVSRRSGGGLGAPPSCPFHQILNFLFLTSAVSGRFPCLV